MAREDGIHRIEVHVAGLCFSKKEGEWRCLIGKRAATCALFSGLWECGGGQVHPGETFEAALCRQMREEFGIEVESLEPFGTYAIETTSGVIPGLKFLCRMKEGQTVRPDGREIVEAAWTAAEEIDGYDLIPGVRDDLKQAFARLDAYKSISP